MTRSRIGTASSSGLPPSTLLAIETAGSLCSAAVVRDGAVLAADRRPMRYGHAEALLPLVGRIIEAGGLSPSQLNAVAVSVGPGGFTGIRVGLAAARGIALAVKARLVGVSSFAAVAAQVGAIRDERRRILLVALDSRRADLYVQLFAPGGGAPLAAPRALLPDQLADFVASLAAASCGGSSLLIAGDAASTAAVALAQHTDCTLATDSAADAVGVAAAALRRLDDGVATGPVRPLYLRPPDVTMPARRPPAIAASPTRSP